MSDRDCTASLIVIHWEIVQLSRPSCMGWRVGRKYGPWSNELALHWITLHCSEFAQHPRAVSMDDSLGLSQFYVR